MKHNRKDTRNSKKGFTIATAFAAAGGVGAQDAATPAPAPSETTLPPEVVKAAEPAPRPAARPAPRPAPVAPAPEPVIEAPAPVIEVEPSYNVDTLSSPKFTQPLLDTPKTVQVIPEKLMKDQGATTLRDALRNVSGISIQAGEGSHGDPGDNLSIRGFAAKTDLFIDGIRDFGAYSRDPFNIEQVEVVKGPSSAYTGRGSTGGSINLVSKTAKLDDFLHTEASGGSDDLRRGTLDFNTRLPIDGAAFRLNVMGHESGTPGRDHVKNQRWGVAGSLAFGLGETTSGESSGKSTFDKNGYPGSESVTIPNDTRLYVNFFHFEEDNIPDFGIPFVPDNISDPSLVPYIGRTAPVPYHTYYGNVLRDTEQTEANSVTVRFEHDINDALTFREQFRYGQMDRYSIATPPRFDTKSNPAFLIPNVKTRDDRNTLLTSQTDLLFSFETGALEHKGILGFEYTEEEFHREPFAVLGTGPINLYRPNAYAPLIPGTPVGPTGEMSHTKATTTAAYIFDTISVTDWLDLTGGFRYDQYDTDFFERDAAGVRTRLGRTDGVGSGQAAVVVKPAENGSVYFGWGTSFNPSGEAVSLSSKATAADSLNVGPEINETYELGTKWNVLDKRLALSAAIFETTKTNARTFDPTDPTAVTVLDGEQQVRGVELGVAGSITPWWEVYAAYTHLDSEVTQSLDPTLVGNELDNTPQNSFSLWTQFDLPGKFVIGGGPTFVDSRFANASNTYSVPSYTIWDAMIGYEVNDSITLRVNFFNIGDKDYFDRIGGKHAVPGAGQSVMFSVSGKF